MDLPDDLQKPFDRLVSAYVRRDEIEGAQKPSLEGSFEAQMKMLSKRQRHSPVVTYDGRGTVLAKGTDIACGCTAHCGHGDHFANPDRIPFRVNDQPQLARPDAVATALKALDARTNRLLEMIARDPLPWWRVPFGKPFKSVGGERYAAPLRGVQREIAHGAGNIGQETRLAQRCWGARAGRDIDALGRRIQHCDARGEQMPGRSGATGSERSLARAIEAEAGDLTLVCLGLFREALRRVDTRPAIQRRASSAA